MEQAELVNLVEAMDWARERMLASVAQLTPEEMDRSLGGSFGSIRATLAHMAWAETIWLSRLWAVAGAAAAPPISQDELARLAPEKFNAAWRDATAGLRTWLRARSAGPVREVIAYSKAGAPPQSTPAADIILQLSHHHAYHRGQIAHMLRQLGRVPPQTDYISYFRQRAAAV